MKIHPTTVRPTTTSMETIYSFSDLILPGESRRRQEFFLSKAKLSHVATLSSFMAGFAIKAVANLQINDDHNDYLLTIFVVITSLLVATTCFVLLTVTWVLPLLKTSERINYEIQQILEEHSFTEKQHSELQKYIYSIYKHVDDATYLTPHLGLKTFRTNRKTLRLVEATWILAGTVAVFLFTLDVIAINWVKFKYFTWTGAMVGTGIISCAIVGSAVFGIYFRTYYVKQFRSISDPQNYVDLSYRDVVEGSNNVSILISPADNLKNPTKKTGLPFWYLHQKDIFYCFTSYRFCESEYNVKIV